MSEKQRVVVTGIGVVTPLGVDEATLWKNMLSGKSGVGLLKAFDTKDYKTVVGAEVDSGLLSEGLRARGLVASDRSVDMALLASGQALSQAGLIKGAPPYAPTAAATVFGSGIGSSQSMYNAQAGFAAKGLRGLRPTTVPRCMTNAISAQVSMKFRLTGPNYVTVCACSSATTAIGIAFRMIQDGHARFALCGGSDAPFDPFVFGAWNNLGVMSKSRDPEKACRPFDAARDGCVLGEGAGALVLESLESARSRGAGIRAEICGFGESSDAEHITSPSVEGQVKCLEAALSSAGMRPEQIGYVNSHGTATKANDECEAQSLRVALGESVSGAPVGANKSFFGHLLGASGAIELIVTIMGLEEGRVPPNLNLDNPDSNCNLLFVGREATKIESPVAMKNSFGFGGNNAVLIVKRWEG